MGRPADQPILSDASYIIWPDLDRVGHGIERLALGARLPAPLEELEVLLLDVGRVGEHHRAEIAGGRSGVDGPVKAIAHQQRQPAVHRP